MRQLEQILIAGGTGFLGEILRNYFEKAGHEIRVLTRNPKLEHEVYWDAKNLGDWMVEVEWASVLINLTGKSVDCRYTDKNKKEILDSRVDSTRILSMAIQKAENPPKVWLNAASATIYVHSDNQPMTEDEGIIGSDFSMNICRAWEERFFKDDLDATRRVALRTSIVMGNEGGAFPQLKGLTKIGMGGKQGDGEQYISWIHAKDFCRAVEFIMSNNSLVGPINVVGPNPVKNHVFMQQLRTSMKQRIGIGQAKWLLEFGALIIGTETELLLKSRYVLPERLTEFGFTFEFDNIKTCLDDLSHN